MAVVGTLVRSASLALTGRPADALVVLWAWGWNLKELPVTLVHRNAYRRAAGSTTAPLPRSVPLAVRRSGLSCAGT